MAHSGMKLRTLVPQNVSPTGVGIGWSTNTGSIVDLTFWVLCPNCTDGYLTYCNSRDPNLVCDECTTVWNSFPGITPSGLRHSGPRFQVWQTSAAEAVSSADDGQILSMIDDWIELWTGLTGIEVSITL